MVRATLMALLVAHAAAFRVRSEQGGVDAKAAVGTIDGLYTYGAPRSGSPGLMANTYNRCFPGSRAWNGIRRLVVTKMADQVPMLTAPFNYQHPLMDSLEFDLSRNDYEATVHPCNLQSQRLPWYRVGDMTLHARTPYVNAAKATLSPFEANFSDIALFVSYFKDVTYVARRVEAFGWRLAAHAYHPGNVFDGGYQMSWLMQQPESLECLITFKGTDSLQDVTVDVQAQKSHFCGLVDRDESCGLFNECRVRNLGSSFVHKGFRDHLRRMVKTEGWQKDIRPKLPSCAKVYVAGHSLGGAMSELLAACISKAPSPGQYGYDEDFQYIKWVKGRPRRLNYL